MADQTALAVHAGSVPADRRPTRDEIELIKRTIAKDATDLELQLFLADNARLGVHPFDRMLHFTKRGGKYVPVTSIDFARSRAAETGEYVGNADPVFTYGAGSDVPTTATATVVRVVKGEPREFTATARMKEYRPPAGQDIAWQRMPHIMLGKCAERQALRKAFPQQLGGLYDSAELGTVDDDDRDPAPPPPAPTWSEKPSAVGETLRQALRATGHAATPEPAPTPTPPAPIDTPLPPQTVTITGVEPARPGSKARGYLTHSGSPEPMPFFSEHVERAAQVARASGVRVVLDVQRTRATHTPYIEAITDAPPPDPPPQATTEPPTADDIPF